MPVQFPRFHSVSFTYATMTRPLSAGIEAHFPLGWIGVVGADGAAMADGQRTARRQAQCRRVHWRHRRAPDACLAIGRDVGRHFRPPVLGYGST